MSFFGAAEKYCFLDDARDPPLETVADTWKNAANVGAARLLRTVHAGDDIDGLVKAIRESKKVILTSTLVAVASGVWAANFVLCPHLWTMTALPLALLDYKRYGRQMILDGFGLEGMYPLFREEVLAPDRREKPSLN